MTISMLLSFCIICCGCFLADIHSMLIWFICKCQDVGQHLNQHHRYSPFENNQEKKGEATPILSAPVAALGEMDELVVL